MKTLFFRCNIGKGSQRNITTKKYQGERIGTNSSKDPKPIKAIH